MSARGAWHYYAIVLLVYRMAFAGLIVLVVLGMCGVETWAAIPILLVPAVISGILASAFSCPACRLSFGGPRTPFGYDVRRNEFGNRCYHCRTWRRRPFLPDWPDWRDDA